MKKTFLLALVCIGVLPAMAWAQPAPGPIPEGVGITLQFPVIAGDVAIHDDPTQPPSDLLRFFNRGDGLSQQAFLFSDVDPTDNDPNDVGIPTDFPQPGLPFAAISESDTGDTIYQPGPGMPGGNPTGGLVTYQIHSDPVPEPASWLLMAAGIAGLYAVAKRRSKTG